jgi:hypothetical protein
MPDRDEDVYRVTELLNRIRDYLAAESDNPGRTYHQGHPTVMLVNAEEIIEDLAMRLGIIDPPQTVTAIRGGDVATDGFARMLYLRENGWETFGLTYSKGPRGPHVILHQDGGITYVGQSDGMPPELATLIAATRRRKPTGGTPC